MSKKNPLWAIQRPDGAIIQESVTFMDPDMSWMCAVDYDKKAMKLYESEPNMLPDSLLKKAGYKLVKVLAVLK